MARTLVFQKIVKTAQKAVRMQSRRDFLKLSGQIGLLSAAAHFLPKAVMARSPRSKEPVAILGAGLAGLSAAYGLQKAGIPFEIFEYQNRFGGRVWTEWNFNDDQMFVERGGELVDSNHEVLISLCKELGLKIQQIKSPEDAEIYYFEGKVFRESDLLPAFLKAAPQIIQDQKSLDAQFRQFDLMNLETYLDRFKNSSPAWFVSMLKIAYQNEFGRPCHEQSSLNFLQMFDPSQTAKVDLFGTSDESKRIEGGNSKLTAALVKKIGSEKIHFGHQLVKLRQKGTQEVEMVFSTGSGARARSFGRVICSIPFSVLRSIEGLKEFPFDPGTFRAIQEWGYGMNSKLMLGFSNRFWNDKKTASILTDLPSQQFWDTSRGQKGNRGILTNFMGAERAIASVDLKIGALQDLEKIFPSSKSKFEDKAILMKWPSLPFVKAAYSCPLVGQYSGIMADFKTLQLGGRFAFAGEHLSKNFSGFMNGAIETGLNAAMNIR